MDLSCLIDPHSSVRVRILGRHRPGDTPYNDYLDAELVITSAFSDGRLGLCLSPEAMDDWSTALDESPTGRTSAGRPRRQRDPDRDRQAILAVPPRRHRGRQWRVLSFGPRRPGPGRRLDRRPA
ncbi:DUF5959 family protein [Streptomyces sp. STR69]|uniref:DUF5959 family protein n=1 Tax=Streptomyces sp. STR69 TaxID=1796942 RepID=UPI003966A992